MKLYDIDLEDEDLEGEEEEQDENEDEDLFPHPPYIGSRYMSYPQISAEELASL